MNGITILEHASMTARHANRRQLASLENAFARKSAMKIIKTLKEGKQLEIKDRQGNVSVIGIGPDGPNMGGDMFTKDELAEAKKTLEE